MLRVSLKVNNVRLLMVTFSSLAALLISKYIFYTFFTKIYFVLTIFIVTYALTIVLSKDKVLICFNLMNFSKLVARLILLILLSTLFLQGYEFYKHDATFSFLLSILSILTIFSLSLLLSIMELSVITSQMYLFVLIMFTLINFLTICAIVYMLYVITGIEVNVITFIFVLIIISFVLIFNTKYKIMKNSRVKVGFHDLAIIISTTPLGIIPFSLALNTPFGGIYWDDIFRYASFLNEYSYMGPTFRSPYIMLFAFHGLLMKLFDLSYIEAYAMSSWINILQPLSIAFFAYALFTFIDRSGNESLRKAFFTVVLLSLINNLLVPLLIYDIINRLHIKLLDNIGIETYYRVLYSSTVDKYGIPGLIPHLLWLKAGSLGFSYIMVSLGLLALLANQIENTVMKHSHNNFTISFKSVILKISMPMLYLIFSLYSGSFVFLMCVLLLCLYLIYKILKSLHNTIPSYAFNRMNISINVRVLATIVLLIFFNIALFEILSKFMLSNIILINLIFLYNLALKYDKLKLLMVLMTVVVLVSLVILSGKIKRIFIKVSKRFLDTKKNMLMLSILSLHRYVGAVMLGVLLAFLVISFLDINSLRYSLMWTQHIALPIHFIALRSYAPSILILSLVLMTPSKSRLCMTREFVYIIILIFLNTMIVCMIGNVFPHDLSYIFVTRSLTYLAIPLSIMASYIIDSYIEKNKGRRRDISLTTLGVLMTVMLFTSLIPTFYSIEAYYLGGKIYGSETQSYFMHLFNQAFNEGNKHTPLVVATLSETMYYFTTSLIRQNHAYTIHLFKEIKSPYKGYTIPWYTYIFNYSKDLFIQYYILSKLNVSYIFMHKYFDRKILENNFAIKLLSETNVITAKGPLVLINVASLQNFSFALVEQSYDYHTVDYPIYKYLLLQQKIIPIDVKLFHKTNIANNIIGKRHIELPSIILNNRLYNSTLLTNASNIISYIEPNSRDRGLIQMRLMGKALNICFLQKHIYPLKWYGVFMRLNNNFIVNRANPTFIYMIIEFNDLQSYDKFYIDLVDEKSNRLYLRKTIPKSNSSNSEVIVALPIFQMNKNSSYWLRIHGISSKYPRNLSFNVILFVYIPKIFPINKSIIMNYMRSSLECFNILTNILIPSPINRLLFGQKYIYCMKNVLNIHQELGHSSYISFLFIDP